jgi:hypothetical protein
MPSQSLQPLDVLNLDDDESLLMMKNCSDWEPIIDVDMHIAPVSPLNATVGGPPRQNHVQSLSDELALEDEE